MTLSHERLADAAERDRMKAFWRERTAALKRVGTVNPARLADGSTSVRQDDGSADLNRRLLHGVAEPQQRQQREHETRCDERGSAKRAIVETVHHP